MVRIVKSINRNRKLPGINKGNPNKRKSLQINPKRTPNRPRPFNRNILINNFNDIRLNSRPNDQS